jgi:hypothetical protein
MPHSSATRRAAPSCLPCSYTGSCAGSCPRWHQPHTPAHPQQHQCACRRNMSTLVPLHYCFSCNLQAQYCQPKEQRQLKYAYVLGLWLSASCMHSKAWLATHVSPWLARLPRTASSAQHSRHLRSTRAAAQGLLTHTEVTKNNIFSMGPKLRYPAVHKGHVLAAHDQVTMYRAGLCC